MVFDAWINGLLLGRTRLMLFIFVAFALSGCSTTGTGSAAERDDRPAFAAFRNSTGQALQTMSVSTERTDLMSPSRMGSISPVQKDHTVLFRLRKDRPRDQPRVVVRWITRDGRHHEQSLSTAHLRDQTLGVPGEAVVFEVFRDGRASCYMDVLPESVP